VRAAGPPTRRRLLGAATLAAALPGVWMSPSAWAIDAPPEVARALPGAQLQGESRFRWFGLHIYDVRLWTAARLEADALPERPFVLELVYARSLAGADIAERSLEEMRHLGAIDAALARAWQDAMRAAFPDVREGDRLSGWHRPGQGAAFFHNARPTGEITDPRFAALFFGIWLSPRSREPALRRALIGSAS
jgi:Chalcone isomerase-like